MILVTREDKFKSTMQELVELLKYSLMKGEPGPRKVPLSLHKQECPFHLSQPPNTKLYHLCHCLSQWEHLKISRGRELFPSSVFQMELLWAMGAVEDPGLSDSPIYAISFHSASVMGQKPQPYHASWALHAFSFTINGLLRALRSFCDNLGVE